MACCYAISFGSFFWPFMEYRNAIYAGFNVIFNLFYTNLMLVIMDIMCGTVDGMTVTGKFSRFDDLIINYI